ncbi:helix-turn-helix transcriptional regulator [Pontibacillus litoralis]|uniref:XRE family transcriptional regulator n=1 Tax=Pontibacillus litoralis JSM 072002 TaxID=1385512 RepID=A0A0A5FWA1_9BACI|nr:helix-turn-helix transcriptional regulator [Pontibacillus litoralis]KGX85041.1 XRE family transcriptional regulator [Pontibacillus litoralis JSM 072002]
MRTWLKELRNQRGYTQHKVSKDAGIERSYYTMIEQGKRNPSVSVAKSIASTLGFDWTIFFDNQCNEMKQNKQAI